MVRRLGEAKARMLMAIGYMQEKTGYASYSDLAILTGRSLSRIRTLVSELRNLGLVVVDDSERPVKIRLTNEGFTIYKHMKLELEKHYNRKLEARDLIKAFDAFVYSSSQRIKYLGPIAIEIDTVVPALRLIEIVNELRNRLGPNILFGVTIELANAVQAATIDRLSIYRIAQSSFHELSKTSINVPIRIARVTDVTLPPHIHGVPMKFRDIRNRLSFATIWVTETKGRDVVSYLNEAKAYGFVNVYGEGTVKSVDEVIVEPRLPTGIDVIDRICEIGFNVISTIPSRAWLPLLATYYSITRYFPTVNDILSGTIEPLDVIRDYVGQTRFEKWMKHVLGLEKTMKITSLKDIGAIHFISYGNETRVVSLSVARRIMGIDFIGIKEYSLSDLYKEVEERVRRILEPSGVFGSILLDIIKRGFVAEEEALKIAAQYARTHDELTLRSYLTVLVRAGFIYPTAQGYYSSWTISPLHDESDEIARFVYVWIDKEVRSLPPDIAQAFDDILRDLIKKREVDIASYVGNARVLIGLTRSFSTLEKMNLVRFVNASTMKIVSEEARRILATVYIERTLGTRINVEPRNEIRTKEEFEAHVLSEVCKIRRIKIS